MPVSFAFPSAEVALPNYFHLPKAPATADRHYPRPAHGRLSYLSGGPRFFRAIYDRRATHSWWAFQSKNREGREPRWPASVR